MTEPDVLAYAIYRNQPDYPGWYVARRWRRLPVRRTDGAWILRISTDNTALSVGTLPDVRRALPAGLSLVRSLAVDDENVVEVWA